MASLFELADIIRASIGEIDQDTGEINPNKSMYEGLFETKAIACAAYIKDESAKISAAMDMVRKMSESIAAREKKLEHFKEYVKNCMDSVGCDKVLDETGTYGITISRRRDVSVKVGAIDLIPDEFISPPKPAERSPDKKKIRAAIESGRNVPGAYLEAKDRFVIK